MPFSPKNPKRLRGKRKPTLHIGQILAWADEHKDRTGEWPQRHSGIVRASPLNTWHAIQNALNIGLRGLPGGSSLARLLAQRRGYRNMQDLPRFKLRTILDWVDEHQERTGRFPTAKSGIIAACPTERWHTVDQSLRKGGRGLPGGSSLPQLLAVRRGHRNRKNLPPYSLKQILKWADDHKNRTGSFPNDKSGQVISAPGETWMAVEDALFKGTRGLPGGSSLARLLAKHRGQRNRAHLPALSIAQILIWADRHKERTGNWPTEQSGVVADSPGETWLAIQKALRNGGRGLRGGTTLPRLLATRRGVRRHVRQPPLSIATILRWADEHKKRTGRWPTVNSGVVAGEGRESWGGVHAALVHGKRGLPGGSSLPKLLVEQRGVRRKQHLPILRQHLILKWIAEHYRLHGRYPKHISGPIPGSSGETWAGVHRALYVGGRGFRGGSSLADVLAKHFGVRNLKTLPKLTERRIVEWLAKHRRRHRVFPTTRSGMIRGSGGETWLGIDAALRHGRRGLRGGSSLYRLICRVKSERG